jgi:tetratricopeptide (TPR) repeat protein
VEQLLQARSKADDFLEAPAVIADRVSERPGSVVGPYRLMEQIGEGGMGLVFVAEQLQPVRRKVALKVIKPGMDTREVVARFEQERQALALMDHPHIARVLDAGTTETGRPFFVMELVKGVPITTYCDEQRLTPRERLGLFVHVCQAVQHAHQKGVIHRDLKPSNVLVASHDGTPVVKVIDFGVAKAVGPKLTDRTVYTYVEQLIGTPLYMSPEQAGLSSLDVDTRTDVYALGVLLYELLTGTTPFELGQLSRVDEMRRIIREQEPPRPSLRISTLGPVAATVSASRRSDPHHLRRLLRGELDWIVMKCLEKDRNRRYESAAGLAHDVERYLNHEPVRAGPPGAAYRLGKLLRRHRGPVLAATLVLTALLAGLAGTAWGLVRAERARQREADRAEAEARQRARADAERDRAEEEKRIAEAVRRFFLVNLLRQADPRTQADALRLAGGEFEAQDNPSVRELLDRAAVELTADGIEAQFPGQPRVQAEVLWTVGFAYLGVGDYDKAIDHLSRARDGSRRALGPHHPKTLATLRTLADAYRRAHKPEQAVPLLEQVRDVQVAELGADHPITLATLDQLAGAVCFAGKPDKAIALFEQVLDARRVVLGPDHLDTLGTLHNLAVAYQRAGKLAEALPRFEQVYDALVGSLGPDHPNTLGALDNLASAYAASGKLDRAVPLFEETLRLRRARLGPDHPDTLLSMTRLGVSYGKVGRGSEGLALLEEALALARKRPGSMPAILPRALVEAYDHGSQYDRSEPLYRDLVEQARKRHGPSHSQTARALNELGRNLLRQRKGVEAEQALRACLAQREKHRPRAWTTFETRALLGASLLVQKKHTEAEPLLWAGYQGLKARADKNSPANSLRLREALDWLIELAEAQGNAEAAEQWRKERGAMAPATAVP